MNTTQYLEYKPDYAIPPGETLLETIEHLGMSQAELAKRTGRPVKTINEIIKGKAAITPDTAIQLEKVLNVPARFWNNLERNYGEALAKIQEKQQLEQHCAWLDKFPIKDLIKAKFIDPSNEKTVLLERLLCFFGVADPNVWEKIWANPDAAYRKSQAFSSNPGSVAAWLRIGELYAQQMDCASYDKAAFRKALVKARSLTTTKAEVLHKELPRTCAETGVAVVFYPELPKTRLCGATRWLSPEKALIQLSLRYKTDDQLWFTFFHEAAHVLFHGKRDVFLHEVSGDKCELAAERDAVVKDKEANKFAEDFLIPPADLSCFLATWKKDRASIRDFAQKIGISPGIVVGRLQHEKIIPESCFNDLKIRIEWMN